MRTSTFAAFSVAAVVGFSFAACNCNPGGGGDGGDDSGFDQDAGCIREGFGCATTSGSTPCCGGALCDTGGGGSTSGVCGASNCADPGQSCTVAGDCCGGRNCINGICSTSTCKATGDTCTSGTECCTTLCNGTCQAIPGQGSACGILGEPCNPDAGAGGGCCSSVCSGGACSPQFTCRASNDVCTSSSQCCSLECNIVGDAGVGTCVSPSGATSCGVSGDPCTPGGGSKCCTLSCTNLGTGTTVCQPTLGCRVQGDTCAAVGDCCGLTASATCASNRCTNGTACRPAGDLCGKPVILLDDGGIVCAPNSAGTGCLTTSSETNCCNGHKVNGQETVCRVDNGGIPRCFGGQSAQCPFGYTGDPGCCIDIGNYCDFRDECCNGAVCANGADGGRQCLASTCKTSGTACTGGSECCSGLLCLPSSEIGNVCQPPQTLPDGGTFDGGVCRANGSTCAAAGDCCSNICDSTGHCVQQLPCQGNGGACAGSGDCCLGLVCNLPAGSTNGTCGFPDGGTSCGAQGQTCTVGGGPCCAGFQCVDPATLNACNGTTTCSCEVVLN
ncbi:MAG TPA: hypothetical protein VND93_20275 [Myxococcales bacterium]|nr:hypothetical protein [Myxococcales bacterium]